MFAGLRHLVPAHLRNFEACASLIHTVGSKANDVARENAQARRIAFFTVFEEHLLAHTNGKERFVSDRVTHRFFHTGRAKILHAVGHCALSGEDHTVCFQNLFGVTGDQHLRADRCNFFNGFADAAQIAGAVVNDGYFHNTPFVDGITLRARGSYSQAMRSARPKDLKTDSH